MVGYKYTVNDMDKHVVYRRFCRLFTEPPYYVKLFLKSLILYTSSLWPDDVFIQLMFWIRTGQTLDLSNPKTFTQKQNWLKLHDRNPRYTDLVDKLKVKRIVAELIGEQYVVPMLGYWKSPEDISFEELPDKFVLKCNHNSGGGMCICKDKSAINPNEVRKNLLVGLNDDFYKYSRVWPYKNVERYIIADYFLDDKIGDELIDYKFWCFNGEPKIVYLTNKGKRITENFYDMEFRPIDVSHGYDRKVPEFTKPESFEQMKRLARILSEGIPFVRIDFFYVEGNIYFGEYTFFDWGGMKPIDDVWESRIGDWIDLSVVKN